MKVILAHLFTVVLLLTAQIAGAGRVNAGDELPYGGELRFRVMREDLELGQHVIQFHRKDDAIVAEVMTDLDVRLGFVRFYRYQHSNREVWQADRLHSFTSRTNDNGTAYSVEGRTTPDGLLVVGSGGDFLAPPGTLPSSWWNFDSIKAMQVVNTQRGQLDDIRVTLVGRETIKVGNASVPARHYRVSGRTVIDIWYDDQDEWVGMTFVRRDNKIRYERLTPLRPAAKG